MLSPQWPAGPLLSNHYNFYNRNLSITIEFSQTIDVNRLMKYSLVLDIFLSKIEIYESNIHHHKMNTNKSINRKIAIILTAKINRIILKEIFAGGLGVHSYGQTDRKISVFSDFP